MSTKPKHSSTSARFILTTLRLAAHPMSKLDLAVQTDLNLTNIERTLKAMLAANLVSTTQDANGKLLYSAN